MNDLAAPPFDAHAFFTGDFAPPASKLLGWTLESADPEAGTIALSFTAKPEFANPAGHVQGGLLAAMLDDTMGPAVVVKSRGRCYAPTIQLNLQYLRPVKPGPIRCEARCVQLGRSIAYMEGQLYDSDGELCVTATTSARVTDFAKMRRG